MSLVRDRLRRPLVLVTAIACSLGMSTQTLAFALHRDYFAYIADTRCKKSRIPLQSTEAASDIGQTFSTLEFTDPESNCQVVLLGCLHGSPASASDVERLLLPRGKAPDQCRTDAVVLELCASRSRDLRRSLEREKAMDEEQQQQSKRLFDWNQFASIVVKTAHKKGLGTGIATAVLLAISGVQTALSGFEPSLEFTTALEIAEELEDCDIILADSAVDKTLRRLGALPSISIGMVREWWELQCNWEESFGREATALTSAVSGDLAYLPNQLSMWRFLTRDETAQKELLRLTLPPLLFSQFLVTTSLFIVNAIEGNGLAHLAPVDTLSFLPDTSFSFSTADILSFGSDLLAEVFTSSIILAFGFVTLALPATRLILCERDDQLTKGVQSACKLAASKDGSRSGRVVAVLGFLHVNGIAKRLLAYEKQGGSVNAQSSKT